MKHLVRHIDIDDIRYLFLFFSEINTEHSNFQRRIPLSSVRLNKKLQARAHTFTRHFMQNITA